MSAEEGDLPKTVRLLIEYSQNKGQIISATDFAILEAYMRWLGEALECPEKMKPWANLVDRIVELSRHEFSRGITVWQKALDLVAKSTSYRMEVTEVKRSRTPIASWGRKRE